MSTAEIDAAQLRWETSGGQWAQAWRTLRRNRPAIVGAVLIGTFVLAAVFAPVLAPFDPRAQGLEGSIAAEAPSGAHPFGLDTLGRDQLSRVIYGARYTLLIGVAAVGVGLSIGLVLGAAAGYFGGLLDTIIMRCMDIMLAVPGLLMAMGIVALLGPGFVQIMVAVGVTQVPIFARLLRASVIAERETDYVLAARAVGVRRLGILASHILPNSISPVIVQGTLALGSAIIEVAGLGFLGLGPQDPAIPEWGSMLVDSNRFLQTAPYLAFIPGAAIVLVVLGFNLVGDALREALDPKLRGRGRRP